MTIKNPYLINTKLPETSTVSYYDVETDQNLTFEEWNQLNSTNNSDKTTVINKSGVNFRSEKDGYGPCKNALCGCDCSSYSCSCANASMKVGSWGPNFDFKGRRWKDDIDPYNDDLNEAIIKSAAQAIGNPKRGASGQVSGSFFGYSDEGGEVKILGGSASGQVSSKALIGRATADLYNVKSQGVQVRVGVGVDTGISLEDGFEAKAIGFGFSVGKKTGISTPFGEIKFDTDDCVIQ